MNCQATLYKRHRFPPKIIQHAIWLYHRFNLSHRDIEDLLAQRGIFVTHESIRLWCNKFGPQYARRLRRGHRGYGDTLFLDEVFVRIQGTQRYLWRAFDQDGEVVDVLLEPRRRGGRPRALPDAGDFAGSVGAQATPTRARRRSEPPPGREDLFFQRTSADRLVRARVTHFGSRPPPSARQASIDE